MARSRNIKPGFFRNENLVELPYETRLLFIGLWTIADREGRFEDRPKRIKMELFPADNIDVDQCLNQLQESGFILRYTVGGVSFVQVLNFVKHQNPHYKEVASEIPAPPGHVDSGVVTFGVTDEQRQRIMDRDGHKCRECGSTERLQIDHIMPRSKGGSGTDDNLQVLCLRCNTSKNNRIAASDVGSSSVQDQTDVGPEGEASPADSLNTDSLNTDSLNTDSGLLEETAQARPDADAPAQTNPRTPKQRKSDEQFERRLALFESFCHGIDLDPDSDDALVGRDRAFRELKPIVDKPAPTPEDFGRCTRWMALQSWRTSPPTIPQVIGSYGGWVGKGKPDEPEESKPATATASRTGTADRSWRDKYLNPNQNVIDVEVSR